ncbi:putative nucleoprotein TPR/MLP1 [Helianthus annuus]|nr:putative nucleoprotein TPR/MLP1 [Helianthus annuus]
MPLFISDEEYARCSHDASLISQKADAYIKQLYNQLETEKAQHDASSITAEQTCSILEQKYVSLKSEFVTLQSQHAQLSSTLEERVSEVAQIQADKHQIYLQSIGKDGEIERLSLEVSELQKSKSQLLQLIEHKDLEINEKNSSIKGYLDKIVALTDTASSKESRISELEAEHARIHASLARLTQEKELVERHNLWLNDELTTKVNSSLELRKTHNELEADMSSKLADIERKYNDTCNTLKWKDDRIKELESKLEALQNELCSSKDTAAATEEQLSSELSTVNKLVELYKESADEWSKKAGELEGVIKALETHASQVEKDYKEKIEKETSARKQFENEVSQLKEKLAKCDADLENYRNSDQLNLLQMSSYNTKSYDVNNTNEDNNNNLMLVPSIPAGISGTALAASLLRDDLEKEHQRWRTAQDNYERQVILQSDTIQELTKTSQELASIKEKASELQRVFDILKAENDELKSKWETEKMVLVQSKDKAEKKFDEINEQNKILLDQLEALHIKLAEKSQGSGAQSSDDGGLQNVVKYLRRSKEIAETEISLLKQEKLRLQSQLEGAMKAESEAQALLRAERENSRAVHFTEEEFKALQVQVREMNLLRESNVQLREENRHNFDECQKLRQSNHNANIEVENLNGLLVQRQNEVEACKRETETYKKNQKDLETRIGELVDKFKDMDPEEYVRMRAEFQQMNVKLSDKDGQLEEIKKLVSEKQLVIVRLEQDLARSKVEIDERESKINTVVQTESSLKSEVDKQKRLIYQLKRRCENLAKEKEETLKKNQELSKELVDSNQVKRSNVDSSGEEKDARIQMLEKTVEKLRDESREKEEKDTRIQMLEKTVDRLRDEVKKGKDEIRSEKSKNQKTEKGIGEERLKLTDDLEKHKHALKTLVDEVEKLKNEGDWFDDVAAACHAAVENFEQMAAHHVSGEFGTVTATDTPPIESTVPVPSRTATSEVVTTTTTAMIPAEESATAKAPAVSKPKVEPRKVARRLVRPRIAKPEQPKRDMDMSEAADANVLSSVRKRPSTSEGPGSHVRDTSVADVAPPQVKKSKASEPPHDGGEVPETVTEESPVGDELQNTKEDEEVETVGDEQAVEDDGEENVNKTETEEQRNVTEVEHTQSQAVTGEGGSEPEEGEMETDQARSPSPMPAEEDMIEETETLGDLEVSSPLLTMEDNEDKTEEGEIEVEETTPESSTDKQLPNDGNDEAGSTAEEAAIDHVPATTAVPVPEKPSKTSAMTEPSASVGNQDSSVSSVVPTSAGPTPEEPVVDTGSTTINLNERARQRSLQRMAGAQPLPPVARGRGRAVRGRTRGGRTGRGGQTPGSQGM